MGFDDFLESKHRNYGRYREYTDYDNGIYSSDSNHSYSGYGDHTNWLRIIKKIWSNRKLKVLAILAVTIILAIAITLIIILVPVILKLINYISQHGLQSLLNGVADFLDKIWNGSAE